jgi:hypothetical protein
MSDSVQVNEIIPAESPTPLDLRRIEVAQYDANIAMYKSILETLPSEWPDHLIQYRNPSNEHDAASQIDDLDDLALVSQLWYADNVYRMIRSETVERTKAAAILAAMETA